jgi:TonB family protein
MNLLAAAIFVAQATLVLAFGTGLLVLMRGSAASSRRLVCLLTLSGACIAPILALFAPSWLTLAPEPPRFLARAASVATAGTGSGGWISLPILVWAAITAIMLARTLAGWMTIWLESRVAALVENRDWLSDASRIARELGLGASPRLRLADVASPLVLATFRPVILLPEAAIEWGPERRRMVLLHELAHAMRFDPWANCVAQVIRAAFWFHPLSWYITARLAREQELACDDEVLRAGVSGVDYAEVLVDAARGLRSAVLFGCAMTGSPAARVLRDRVEHVLDERRKRMGNGRQHALVVSAFAAVLLITGALRPVWSQNGKIYRIGDGVSAPQLLHKVEPDYTQEAKDQKIEGKVILFLVITDDGQPTDVTVTGHLDPGLDENAVSAVKQWRFKPGMKDNEPVAVQAHIEVNYRLY